MISTRLQLTAKNKVKLCFVCSGIPFFYLFAGGTAETRWVATKEAPVARSDRDPPWVPKIKLISSDMTWRAEDQVIIYEGNGPSSRDVVWSTGARRIAWVDITGRGKARVPKNAGWHTIRRSISHSALGGVTNAVFSCFLVSRVEEDSKWQFVATGIRATMRQVVDPTNGGRTVSAPTEQGLQNSAGGLLDWSRRFAKVIVPTVYSNDMLAERWLTDVELADVLDLPGTLRKRLNSTQLAKVRGMSVPGKVVVALFESLNTLIARTCGTRRDAAVAGSDDEGSKRKATGVDLQGTEGAKKSRVEKEKGVEVSKEPFMTVSEKATKSDDAPAPVHLFDDRIHASLGIAHERRPRGVRSSRGSKKVRFEIVEAESETEFLRVVETVGFEC